MPKSLLKLYWSIIKLGVKKIYGKVYVYGQFDNLLLNLPEFISKDSRNLR